MSVPTDYEQYVMELVNRARLNPGEEAQRVNIGLNDGLSAGRISNTSKQVLAFNPLLNDAAEDHSRWQLNTNTFSHTGAGGSDPGDRMAAAGYAFNGNWTWGENIAWNGTTGTLQLLPSVDQAHDGLFRSSGHRLNILNGDFKELGIGIETGRFTSSGTVFNAMMMTQNFATSGAGSFVTGVVYNDTDGDDFYSVGEGRSGVRVSVSDGATGLGSMQVWDSGGYSLRTTAAGDLQVRFSGGGLASAVSVDVSVSNRNVKVDLVGDSHINSSADTHLRANAVSLQLLGLDDLDATGNTLSNQIHGNAGSNRLDAGAGNDLLTGGPGNDVILGRAGRDRLFGDAGNDVVKGGGGNDSLLGGGGNDRLMAGSGDDMLNGGPGRDKAKGNAGADSFIFATGGDRDRIVDFAPGTDTIDVSDFNLASFAGLQALASEKAAGLVINFGGGDILKIAGLSLADLASTDVIL